MKSTSGPPLPSSLFPNTCAAAFRPGSNGDCCTYIVGFFMTAILFNIAPEDLCSVFQSSKYKSSLNLSPKRSYCSQERILEECGPDFHSLIWRLWFMFYSILLPLPPALLSWGLFCSISYHRRTNEFLCPRGLYPLFPYLSPFISVTLILSRRGRAAEGLLSGCTDAVHQQHVANRTCKG